MCESGSSSSSASLARMGQLMGRCRRRRSAETNQRSFVRPRPNDTCRLKSHDIQQPDANELYCAPHEPRWKYTGEIPRPRYSMRQVQLVPGVDFFKSRLSSEHGACADLGENLAICDWCLLLGPSIVPARTLILETRLLKLIEYMSLENMYRTRVHASCKWDDSRV